MSFTRSLVTNHALANIAFAVVIVMGLIAYATMPREQDPEINFNWVNISTALPGASAADVESRVTGPLEDAIRNIQDVRFVVSSSREGISNILVRFRDISERNFDKRINDLRREIQSKANIELPADAIDPQILEITTSNGFPTAMLVLKGQADDETLRQAAFVVREDIEQVAGVDRVLAIGFREPELQVDFDPQRLAAHGLNAADLANGLGGWFRDTFAGSAVTRASGEWLVRVVAQSPEPEQIARFLVSPQLAPGRKVPVDAVASVERGRDEARQLAAFEGRPAVLMSVTKIEHVNTLELVERLRAYAQRKNEVLAGSGLSLVLSDDQTVATREALGVMQWNAGIGLLLVLGVCWMFLGTRIALVVSLGVVFSVTGVFWALQMTGSTLNVSVLLGVVIVLGMLVDDAVVVVEAIYFRMQRGMQALEATLDALREVAAPVLAAVMTTIAAFMPLMLLPGIVGKFMFVIPFVVTVGLAISLVEAFWMLPAHIAAMGSGAISRGRSQRRRERLTHLVRVRYTRALIHVMRRPLRYMAGVGVIFLLALTLVAVGALTGRGPIKFQFFAFDPIRLFYVNVDMPPEAPVEDTLARTMLVEREVRAGLLEGEARSVTSLAGIKFTEMEPLYGSQYGQIAVSLNPADPETRRLGEIVQSLRERLGTRSGPAKLSFLELSGGPPTEKPISVKVRADDYAELRAATDAVKEIAAAIPGARDVVDNDVPGRQQLVLQVDVDAARNAGMDPALVARLVRLHVDGEVVADLRDRGEKLELRVRAEPRQLERIEAVLADPVALPGGAVTTLGALLHAQREAGPALIRHWNLRRAITVEGSLDRDTTDTVAANRQLREGWEKVRSRFPNADLDFSGELDDIEESLDAMGVLFLLGLGLIYLILAAQFRSYFQPLLILVTVPLAFTGVTIGLLITGHPLSLYTLYGIIALTGIAVNAAIVLIDAANRRRQTGMRVLHATIYAARRRVIAVLMTTGTTIAGLASLAFGFGGTSLLWGPVASSIVWGLVFATALTLFVVPPLYRLFMRGRPSPAVAG